MVDLLLRIPLVRAYGLLAITLGALIPVGVVSLFLVCPASCRRVRLSVAGVVRSGVRPAHWLGLPAAGAVFAVRDPAGTHLLVFFTSALVGGLPTWSALSAGRGVSHRRWDLENVNAPLWQPRAVVAT